MGQKQVEYFKTKAGKMVFFGLVGIVPVFVLVFAVVSFFTSPSSRQIMIEDHSKETMHGVVDSVYNDSQNHNARMVILNDKMPHEVEQPWVIDIEKGDSLSKNKGSFLFEVYRKPNKKLILDFRTLIPPEK
jgi:hypothetical protein